MCLCVCVCYFECVCYCTCVCMWHCVCVCVIVHVCVCVCVSVCLCVCVCVCVCFQVSEVSERWRESVGGSSRRSAPCVRVGAQDVWELHTRVTVEREQLQLSSDAAAHGCTHTHTAALHTPAACCTDPPEQVKHSNTHSHSLTHTHTHTHTRHTHTHTHTHTHSLSHTHTHTHFRNMTVLVWAVGRGLI